MVLSIIGKHRGGKNMLNWLVEDRKVRRLYDHYRVYTSGFKVVLHSDLLHKSWMKYQENTKMKSTDGFKDSDDSCFDGVEYIVDDVVRHKNAKLCLGLFPKQICRSASLFGNKDVIIDLDVLNRGQTSPIPTVASISSKHDLSRFRSIIEPNHEVPLRLCVSSHRGHYGSSSPENLLQSTKAACYRSDGCGPVPEDWIIFKQLTSEAVPTAIVIWNSSSGRALKNIKVLGSVDNVVFEEWIAIQNIANYDDLPQRFELDPASVYCAWSRGFKYFRLSAMQNYGASCMVLYQFQIRGVRLGATSQCTMTVDSTDFVDGLHVAQNNKIVSRTDVSMGSDIEFKEDDIWRQASVSQETADKICVKWSHSNMVCYRWIQRDDIPTAVRPTASVRRQMSLLTFTLITEINDGNESKFASKEYTFDADAKFEIPLNEVVSYSATPETIAVCAKPKGTDFAFETIKRVDCSTLQISSFFVEDSFHINTGQSKHDFDGKYEVVAATDIIVSKSGRIGVSPCVKTGVGIIRLISGGDVVNEGTLSCCAKDDSDASGGTVYINTDGAFVNEGTINCGENGSVSIHCSEFRNDGTITPKPKVKYKDAKMIKNGIQKLSTMGGSKRIILKVSSHRGNYDGSPPANLLVEGTDSVYDSDGKGPPEEDWIIFQVASEERILPNNIVIRNSSGRTGIREIKIEASSDGMIFDDWMQIENISRESEELQVFELDSASVIDAWEKAFIFFKVNIVENHGAPYNVFYEFRINGLGEEEE